jgi:UDP-glucose 4-epimerase
MSIKPLVLITGATGAIGPCVVQAFHHAGYRIRTFSHIPPAEGIFPENIEVVIGNVTDKGAVQSAMQGVDAVIHLAALLHIFNPPPQLNEKYEKINVGGTRNVVDAAISAGVQRIVLFSTIAVYGRSREGGILNEQSKTQPETYYAETKLAAEQIVQNAHSTNGKPLGAVLRLGAVYGSGFRGNYERLTQALARKRFIPIGIGLNRRTLIYDKDVAKAALLAAFHPMAAGRIFNVTDGKYPSMKEIIASICSALGRKSPVFSLPLAPVLLLIDLADKITRALGLKAPLTRATIDKYTEDIAVDGSLIQKELGFVPAYDLKRGWEEAIGEMRYRNYRKKD